MAGWTAASLTPGLRDNRGLVQANMLNPNSNVTNIPATVGDTSSTYGGGFLQSSLLAAILGASQSQPYVSTAAQNIQAMGAATAERARANTMTAPLNILSSLTGGPFYNDGGLAGGTTSGAGNPLAFGGALSGHTGASDLITDLDVMGSRIGAGMSANDPAYRAANDKYMTMLMMLTGTPSGPSAVGLAAQAAARAPSTPVTYGGRLPSQQPQRGPQIANVWGANQAMSNWGLPPVLG